MADTFTPNYNLVLPEVGGSPDTWGAKLNENFSEVDGRLIPSGLISLWSGAINTIPSGWALCDGTNGTPDLRDRFIVGAGAGYAVGDTGGAAQVTLTEAQIPAHNHSASTGSNGDHSHSGTADTAGDHSHSGTADTAGDHSHNVKGINGSDKGGGTFKRHNTSNVDGYNSTETAGAHSHSLNIDNNGAHTHSLSINSNGAHTHTISPSGGDEPHENRPPYYALAYIMKL